VAVLHGSRQNIRNGLDAAVRMPWKASEIVLRNIIAEIIKQKKRIKVLRVAKAKCAAQMHACSFESRLRFDETFHRSNRHLSLRYSDLDVVRRSDGSMLPLLRAAYFSFLYVNAPP